MLARLTSPRNCAVKGALHVSLSGAGLPSSCTCLGTKHVPERPPAPTPPAGLRQLQGSGPQTGQRRHVVVHVLKCGNRRGRPRPDGSSWPRESSEPLAGLSASLSLRQDQLSTSEPPAPCGRGFRQAGLGRKPGETLPPEAHPCWPFHLSTCSPALPLTTGESSESFAFWCEIWGL